MKKIHAYRITLLLCVAMISCQKDFLDKKPDQALIVPVKVEDFQLLLDNSVLLNQGPILPLISTDDYYTTDAGWKGYRTASERNAYLWKAEVYEGEVVSDWNTLYQFVFYANVVIDGLEKVRAEIPEGDYKRLRGTALFLRGFAFFMLVQEYAAPYRPENASQVPGVPLKLSSDVNIRPARGTLQESYQQVISDLQEALVLLPERVQIKTRPDRCAAAAVLARVFLSRSDFEQAGRYASQSLELNAALLDYNNLTLSAGKPIPSPFTAMNPEVIYYSTFLAFSSIGSASALTSVDTLLFESYHADDLRKAAFFNNRGNRIINFKGSYTGVVAGSSNALFSGLATDEMYLTRAECRARLGDVTGAMGDLNALMMKRFRSGKFVDLVASNPREALELVLTERRKELVARGTRWMDLRRLNLEPAFAVTLRRKIEGVEYTLAPNDPRYVFALAEQELIPGKVDQNIR